MVVPFCIPSSNEWEGFCCSTFSSAFGVVSVTDSGHSNRCVVVSHCFNSHFPDDISCGAYFHMLICHLCIFFGEVSVRSLAHFLIWLFVFLLLSFKSLFYILNNSSLSGLPFANIFFQSIACLIILLTVSITEQTFLILMKSSLSIISFMGCAFGVVSKKDITILMVS